MKTLVDEISGRKDLPIFNGSNEGICDWVNLNLESITALNEPHSCSAMLEDEFIIISGDEDSKELRIVQVNAIDVD